MDARPDFVAQLSSYMPIATQAMDIASDIVKQLPSVVLDRMFAEVQAGAALVLATHDPEVSERCDRILDLSSTPD